MNLWNMAYGLMGMGLFTALMLLAAMPLLRGQLLPRLRTAPGLIELQCYGAVVTVVYLGLAGLVIALLPVPAKRTVAWLALILPFIAAWRAGRRPARHSSADGQGFYLRAVLFFTVLLLGIASFNWPLPTKLPDGAYVNKENVSSVRIQRFTGDLPADNVVSFVAMEYMARNISFVGNAPILPGQQVTNRPVLAALVALPIRLVLRPTRALPELPRFDYVDNRWPDFRVLVRDERLFAVYLGVLVLLNGLMLLGAGALVSRACGASTQARWLCVLLYCSSPYFLIQTLFTWPKALAGFFVLLAATAWWWRRRPALAGALVGLAYLSHPYAIGYAAIGVAAMALCGPGRFAQRFKAAVLLAAAFAAVVLPWWVWTYVVIDLPSDLVTQNMLVGQTDPFAIAWMRVSNIANALLPVHLTNPSALFIESFVQSARNVTGAVGTLAVAAWLMARVSRPAGPAAGSPAAPVSMLAVFAIASAMLAMVFSMPAVPAIHGAQPLAALMLCAAVHAVCGTGLRWAVWLLWAQILINLLMWGCYFQSVLSLPAL